MDSSNPITAASLDVGHQQHEVCELLPDSEKEGYIIERISGSLEGTINNELPNETTEVGAQLEESENLDCFAGKDGGGSPVYVEGSDLTISKESSVEDAIHINQPIKGHGKSKTEKPSRPKNLANGMQRNKDGKHLEAISSVSDGSVTSKQPLALATNRKYSNDAQLNESIGSVGSTRHTKPGSAPSSTENSLQSENSFTASTTEKVMETGDLKNHAKILKPLKQGQPPKVEEDMHHASLSPPAGGTKPSRTGGLPSYTFTFKCDVRAEKRKEFYSKLDEKIHEKEKERTTLQEKSKETQEAEIKKFRKSLMFKATPMPSFYHEPSPPKVELKKIPPTRAKSPKLGRQKSSPTADPEGNDSHTSRLHRLSLDEKVTRNQTSKGSLSQHSKKPRPKSLPKLPSETSESATTNEDLATEEQITS